MAHEVHLVIKTWINNQIKWRGRAKSKRNASIEKIAYEKDEYGWIG